MNVEIINWTPNPEYSIVNAARICYEHFSTLEHASFTFKITGISRACSHQLVRHRLASYSQRSQRYVEEDNFEFIIPDSIKKNLPAAEMFISAMKQIDEIYKKMLNLDIRKEDARYLLPNACSTEIIMTINARSLKNFFELRLDSHAQWEIRRLAEMMYIKTSCIAPNVFPEPKSTE